MINVWSWSGWRPRRPRRIVGWCRPKGCCWPVRELLTRRSRAVVVWNSDTVRRWRCRFAEQGTAGVGWIAKGRGRKPGLPAGTVEEVLRLTDCERPADYVEARARPGDVGDVLATIDEYAYEKSFLVNVGEEKGRLLDAAVRRADPRLALELGTYCGYGALRIARADAGGPKVLVRCDSAGATHTFAQACRTDGVGFSFGYAVDSRVRDAAETLNEGDCWYPAIEAGGDLREGAWVAEATDLVDMSRWPAGTRLILRKERPHPGAQLNFTDSDGMRLTAFITDTPPSVIPGQIGGLELRHRQHARVEDRIRQAKATGLRNLPCHRADANSAWLEIILAATDLVAWTQLIGFTDHPELATCEIETFRYRVLHVAARITRSARQTRLRIDATWRWATAISQAWQRLRAAFP